MTRAIFVLTALGLAGPALAQTAAPTQTAPVAAPTVPAVRTAPETPPAAQPAPVETRTAPLVAPGAEVQPGRVPPAVVGGAATSASQ